MAKTVKEIKDGAKRSPRVVNPEIVQTLIVQVMAEAKRDLTKNEILALSLLQQDIDTTQGIKDAIIGGALVVSFRGKADSSDDILLEIRPEFKGKTPEEITTRRTKQAKGT